MVTLLLVTMVTLLLVIFVTVVTIMEGESDVISVEGPLMDDARFRELAVAEIVVQG